MRIGFVLDGFVGGGTARVTAIVANNLQRLADYECFALAYTKNGKPEIYETEFPVKYVFEKTISMQNAILKKHYISTVKQFVKENNIQVLVSCGVQFYPVVTLVAKICKIKSICWEHLHPPTKNDFQFQDQCRVVGALTSNSNIVLTKSALSIYNKRFRFSKNYQIYNPIDPILLESEPTYDCSSNKIVSVGRLGYQKNFERLINIANVVLKNNPAWKWDIYGEGPDRQVLQKMINELGLESNVTLKGQVNDIYSRYKNYAMMVMTSRYEGFPMTLLEGAANGLPMISFDIPTGPNEIIENGRNGYLCYSDEEMIEKIDLLFSSIELRKKLSIGSRETAEKYSIKMIIEEWEIILKSLVKS